MLTLSGISADGTQSFNKAKHYYAVYKQQSTDNDLDKSMVDNDVQCLN